MVNLNLNRFGRGMLRILVEEGLEEVRERQTKPWDNICGTVRDCDGAKNPNIFWEYCIDGNNGNCGYEVGGT